MLFSSCIPVKGFCRSLICDLQRGIFYFIPNGLYDLILTHSGKSKTDILSNYEANNHFTIDEYFEFLEKYELIHWMDQSIEQFPLMSLFWDSPVLITNSIVVLSKYNLCYAGNIVNGINNTRCKNLQIFSLVNHEECHYFVDLFNKSTLQSIEIFIEYDENFDFKKIFTNSRVTSIVAHSSPNDKHIDLTNQCVLSYVKHKIASFVFCGVVKSDYFTVNTSLFTESLHHNSCLNRKISIDADGVSNW